MRLVVERLVFQNDVERAGFTPKHNTVILSSMKTCLVTSELAAER